MIGERYAVAGRRTTSQIERRRLLPAIAGRERLLQALSSSVLVQIMLAMTCVAVAGLLYLAQASQASVLQFSIGDQQTRQVQLSAENASLRQQATQLQSLRRVDFVATTQLHMTKPELSSAVWITATAPRLPAVRTVRAGMLAAERASQPLAWIDRAVRFVQSSL
jgi:cell division protein FtsL